jgi:hypothetical protein
MAFCNSCGAPLAEGTSFCSKCGSAITGAPAATPPPIAPGPAPSTGSSSTVKIILIVVGIAVLICILGMVTCGLVFRHAIKNAKVSQKGDNVKIETPFGNMETSDDPQKVAEELGIDIYPGAHLQKEGTAAVTFGSLHTITANFESGDSVEKVCDFYRLKFPGANVASSDKEQCTIISTEKGAQTNVSIQSNGEGSRFTIVKVMKKS